jgi:hypothetical protein
MWSNPDYLKIEPSQNHLVFHKCSYTDIIVILSSFLMLITFLSSGALYYILTAFLIRRNILWIFRPMHILFLLLPIVVAENTVPNNSALTAGCIATVNILALIPAIVSIPEIKYFNLDFFKQATIRGDGNCFFRALCRFSKMFDFTESKPLSLKPQKTTA